MNITLDSVVQFINSVDAQGLAQIMAACRRRDERTTSQKFFTFNVGDSVRFNQNTHPTYLRGAEAKIVKMARTRVVVELKNPVGRFSGRIRTSVDLIDKV